MNSNRIDLAKKAALQAGSTLLDLYKKGDQTGFLKEDRTLVTEADKLADKTIQDLIMNEFPEDQVLSEEKSTIFPNSEHVWVVDPLDGTVNFSRGFDCWGVSIAHLENGMPHTAALYFPVSDELFTAEKGNGAFLNGRPLKVSKDFNEDLFPIFVHCSRMHKRYTVSLPYKNRSLGAAAYHLCLIANNKAVLALESTVRIWDFAASWLVIQEAGGFIKSFEEKQPFPALPEMDYHGIPFPIIAGASKELVEESEKNIVPRGQ